MKISNVYGYSVPASNVGYKNNTGYATMPTYAGSGSST